MPVGITIVISDIDNVMLDYDKVKVFSHPDGNEITALVEQAASIAGTVVGPFAAIVGKTLIIKTKTGADQVVTFTGTSIAQVVIDCNNAFKDVIASSDGGKLRLTTDGLGTEEILSISGGTALTDLGFLQDDYDIGNAERISLVAGQKTYYIPYPWGQRGQTFYVHYYNSVTFDETTDDTVGRVVSLSLVPERYPDARSPRGLTLIRGETFTFRHAFFTDAKKTTPLIPKDTSKYPSVTIIDSNGQVIAAGVGTLDGTPGNYKYDFAVPSNAAISTDYVRWRCEWLLVSTANRQVSAVAEFDVRDIDLSLPDDETVFEHKMIALPSKQRRVKMVRTRRPYSAVLRIAKQSDTSVYVTDNINFPYVPGPGISELHETIAGDYYLYWYDVGSTIFEEGETYILLWEFQDTITSEANIISQVIDIPPIKIIPMMSSLRMVIDKYQRDRSQIQAYRDSDLYEYIQRGQDIINVWVPLTSYSLTSWPGQLAPSLMIASALWALNARHLLEVELSFQFCLEENSLVRTDYGLVKAKHLGGLNQSIIAAQHILDLNPVYISVLESCYKKLRSGFYHTRDMLSLCNIKGYNAKTFGDVLARLGLSRFRSTDHAGGWLWDIGSFWEYLSNNYGLSFERQKPTRIDSLYNLMLCDAIKKPLFVWDLGYKPVYEMTTELGFREVCTKDHGFLVLNTSDFSVTWKTLKDISDGDYIAIDTTPEPNVDWDVYFDHVKHLSCSNAREMYTLPKKLTPDLARVLGYLVSEGTCTFENNVIFTNSDSRMLKDYSQSFKRCFGKKPEISGITFSEKSQQAKTGGKECTHLRGDGVYLRRYLAAIGLDYTKSREKEIPWCILQAPCSLVKEYLHAYMDGDGCFSVNDNYDDSYRTASVIFCSWSDIMLSQLQALLLRFGIVSKAEYKHHKLTIRGPSLVKYNDIIGWGRKRGYVPQSKFYSQREIIPIPMLTTLRKIKDLFPQVSKRGWYIDGNGKRRRVRLYWRHCDGYAKRTTWNHVAKWWKERQATIQILNPLVAKRISFLIKTKFLWQKVISIKSIGDRRVFDPCLPEGRGILAHGFVANGIINHNSGQSITLEHDAASPLDGVVQRLWQWLQDTTTKFKTSLYRQSHMAGVVMGRPMRIGHLSSFIRPTVQTNPVFDMPYFLSCMGLTS